MKVLQVNNVYADQSTGKITKQLRDGLTAQGHESLVAYGRGQSYFGNGITRLCSNLYGKLNSLLARLTGIAYGGCFFSTNRLIALIKKEKPDVVHLQCINGNFVNIYRLVSWLKNNGIKTVVSLHAEFMYTANCPHAFDCEQWKRGCKKCPDKRKATKSLFFDNTALSWRKMKKAFEGFENDCIICPVSPWTEERAKQSEIFKNFRFKTVMNGVDTDIFNADGEPLCKDNTVLHVTAHFSTDKDHAKGGWYLAELAKLMPDVTFKVAGDCSQVKDLPENVLPLGRVNDQNELARLYREAKVSVIVSKKETFSMPCAESICCGTPVVGFEAGAPEQISLPEHSEFVPQGAIGALKNTVEAWLAKDIDRNAVSLDGKRAYSVRTMVDSFIKIYEEF